MNNPERCGRQTLLSPPFVNAVRILSLHNSVYMRTPNAQITHRERHTDTNGDEARVGARARSKR